MGTVLSITIPFFAIIFLGTAFSAKKIFDSANAKILTNGGAVLPNPVTSRYCFEGLQD